MNRHRKKSLSCRLAALLFSFVMIVAFIPAAVVQADSDPSPEKYAVTLKYKGKTLDISYSIPSYKEIEKTFGKPDSVEKESYGEASLVTSTYKADGFCFTIRRIKPASDDPDSFGKHIVITSKKASMNGIKVGMSYDKVKERLVKLYGEANLKIQKNKKKIVSDSEELPFFEYIFKDGKLSKMQYLNS